MAQQGKMPSADVSYVKKMPGMAIAAQLLTCFMAFICSVGASSTYYVSSGHGFFIFITFLATVSCIFWLLLKVFNLETVLPANLNWNHAGLIHNGVFGFLIMVGSCVMVDLAEGARVLMAAGIFGFFGFTGFVAALVFEASAWYKNRPSPVGMASATVVQGSAREEDTESRESTGDPMDGTVAGFDPGSESNIEPYGSYSTRPTSSVDTERQNMW